MAGGLYRRFERDKVRSGFAGFSRENSEAPKRLQTYEDVAGVGDGSDDSSSNHELLPCLSEVDDVNSFSVALVHVWVHQV